MTNKPNGPPTTLEGKIVAVLTGSEVSSATAMEVLELVEANVAEITGTIESDRTSLLDLVQCPDPEATKSRIAAAETSVSRLSAQLPKIRAKISRCLESERHSRWEADFRRLKIEQSALARDFAECYPRLVTELVYLFNRMAALDHKCAEVDGQAANLTNEHRRLGKTELLARGMSAYSRAQPELAKSVVLPDFDQSARTRWPATSPTSFAASFSESMVSPHSANADWGQPTEVARRKAAIESSQAALGEAYARMTAEQTERENREMRESFEASQRRR